MALVAGVALLGSLLLPAITTPSGAVEAPGAAVSGAASTSADTDATNSPVSRVRRALIDARRGAPKPTVTRPSLDGLEGNLADTGACTYRGDFEQLCPRGDPDAERSLVVIGDSHGRVWIPAFDQIGATYGLRVYYLVKSRCTAANVVPAKVDDSLPYSTCVTFHAWVREQIEALRPDMVVVASSMAAPGIYVGDRLVTDPEQVARLYRRGSAETFEFLRQYAGTTWLLKDVPVRMGRVPGDCLRQERFDLGDCLATSRPSRQVLTDAAVRAAYATGTPVVDPEPWLCLKGVCPVVLGDLIPYRDAQHLTTDFTATLAEPLAARLGISQDGAIPAGPAQPPWPLFVVPALT